MRIRFPSSSTPAFIHFWMSRTTRRSAMRCSMNFTSHSCEIVSKNPRISRFEHPVHLLRQQSGVKRIQRVVLASLRTEPVRKSKEVRFVDSVHHLDRRSLNDLILPRGYSERSHPPLGLGDIHPTHLHDPPPSLLPPPPQLP